MKFLATTLFLASIVLITGCKGGGGGGEGNNSTTQASPDLTTTPPLSETSFSAAHFDGTWATACDKEKKAIYFKISSGGIEAKRIPCENGQTFAQNWDNKSAPFVLTITEVDTKNTVIKLKANDGTEYPTPFTIKDNKIETFTIDFGEKKTGGPQTLRSFVESETIPTAITIKDFDGAWFADCTQKNNQTPLAYKILDGVGEVKMIACANTNAENFEQLLKDSPLLDTFDMISVDANAKTFLGKTRSNGTEYQIQFAISTTTMKPNAFFVTSVPGLAAGEHIVIKRFPPVN